MTKKLNHNNMKLLHAQNFPTVHQRKAFIVTLYVLVAIVNDASEW